MVNTEVCFSFWLSCTMRGGSNQLGYLYKDNLILFYILLNVESMSQKRHTPYCNNVECPGDASVPPESVCPLFH